MKKSISIQIGGFHASRNPAVIQTLVGSCVAVCLYDRVAHIGGMNHIFLPGKADMLQNFDHAPRYAVNAMELLVNRIMKLGGKRSHLVAKVFGGAHVVPAISPKNGMGTRNSEFVLEFLQTENICVVNQDLGGNHPRKIFFHTDSGKVLLKRILSTQYPNFSLEERRLLELARSKAEESEEDTPFD